MFSFKSTFCIYMRKKSSWCFLFGQAWGVMGSKVLISLILRPLSGVCSPCKKQKAKSKKQKAKSKKPSLRGYVVHAKSINPAILDICVFGIYSKRIYYTPYFCIFFSTDFFFFFNFAWNVQFLLKKHVLAPNFGFGVPHFFLRTPLKESFDL